MSDEAEPKLGTILTGRTVGPIRLQSIIGSGSFAVVYLGQSLTNPRTRYAVKCLFKDGLTSSQLEIQRAEAELLLTLRGHENIVTLQETIETADYLFLVLEHCDGDLFDAVDARGTFSDDLVRDVFGQLCDAVQYSHENGVYHRDLKPENVLVVYGDKDEFEEEDGEEVKEISVKLTDFGLATTDAVSSEFGCGSVRYMAPECLAPESDADRTSNEYASAPADVWALGVILINLLTGQNPWSEPSVATDPLYAAYRKTDPELFRSQFGFSAELNAILCRVFDVDPASRPSLVDLKAEIQQCAQFFAPSLEASPAVPETVDDHAVTHHALPALETVSIASWASDVSEMNYDVPPFETKPTILESEELTVAVTVPTAVIEQDTSKTIPPLSAVPSRMVVLFQRPPSPRSRPTQRRRRRGGAHPDKLKECQLNNCMASSPCEKETKTRNHVNNKSNNNNAAKAILSSCRGAAKNEMRALSPVPAPTPITHAPEFRHVQRNVVRRGRR